MIFQRVVGVDPGPIPGLCVIDYYRSIDGLEYHPAGVKALQCSANWIEQLAQDAAFGALENDNPVLLTVEKYVPRQGRGSQLAAGANQQTQEMAARLIGKFTELAKTVKGCERLQVRSYTPAQVMPWADEKKLRKVGLWDATVGCKHARAAAQHALYAACKDGGMPNPLSQRANPRAAEIITKAHAVNRTIKVGEGEITNPTAVPPGGAVYVAPVDTPLPADPRNPGPPWKTIGSIRSFSLGDTRAPGDLHLDPPAGPRPPCGCKPKSPCFQDQAAAAGYPDTQRKCRRKGVNHVAE